MPSTLPTRRTQQRSLETRDSLVAAALREFAEHGFGAASTRAIAKRAGVAQSAVPYHFTTKQALWKAAADRIFEQFQAQFAARIRGLDGVDALTRARLLLGDFVRFAASHPELHRFMLQEGTGHSDRLEWLVETHLRPMVAFVRELWGELESSGHALPGPSAHLYYAMIGAASTVYALAPEVELTMGEDPFSKEMVDAHVELLVRLFFPELALAQDDGASR